MMNGVTRHLIYKEEVFRQNFRFIPIFHFVTSQVLQIF